VSAGRIGPNPLQHWPGFLISCVIAHRLGRSLEETREEYFIHPLETLETSKESNNNLDLLASVRRELGQSDALALDSWGCLRGLRKFGRWDDGRAKTSPAVFSG